MSSTPSVAVALVAFLAAIGPLVLVHELGHYLVARAFGVGAERFSIGFGKPLASWTDKRGTAWTLGWLPMGGYVRFLGDANAASLGADAPPANPVPAGASVQGLPFHDRPVGQRFLIVLAGPLANFLLAILLFAGFFAFAGAPGTPNIVGGVLVDGPAARAGIRPGDRILAVDGSKVRHFEDIALLISPHPGERLMIKFAHGDSVHTVPVVAETARIRGAGGQEAVIGRIGIARGQLQFRQLEPVELLPEAVRMTGAMTRAMLTGLAQIVTGRRDVRELGGPVRMAQIAGQAAQLGLFQFVQLVALFSINLGFINLLPVPLLDGGHLAFYTIEAVRRRPLGERAQEWAFRGGLALLLGLMLLTTFNDSVAVGLFDRIGRLIG